MDINEVKKTIDTAPEYQFLKTDPYLGDNLIMLVLGGSHAYGTNIETSDIDVRGCTANTEQSLLGMQNFEQLERHAETDTVIYALTKFFKLLTSANPNVLEMIANQPRNWIYMSPLGKQIIDNRHLFLSKKVAYSFGGYATAQLRRLQNAVCRDRMSPNEQEYHMMNSINTMLHTLNEKYAEFEEGSFRLEIGPALNPELETEIFIDVNLKHYPLRDYKAIWSEMNNVVKDYTKTQGQRNKKKDELHLNKHICHLFRLYLMAFDLLEQQEIVTYRENDVKFLMDIRNGCFLNSDGTIKPELYKLLDSYEARLQKDTETTKLPERPNYGEIDKLLIKINREYLLK